MIRTAGETYQAKLRLLKYRDVVKPEAVLEAGKKAGIPEEQLKQEIDTASNF